MWLTTSLKKQNYQVAEANFVIFNSTGLYLCLTNLGTILFLSE